MEAEAHDAVVLWQLSQLPVTAAWVALLGLPTAPRAAPLWHVAQPVLTLKLAWNRPLAQVAKLPLWQLSQLALAATGTEA